MKKFLIILLSMTSAHALLGMDNFNSTSKKERLFEAQRQEELSLLVDKYAELHKKMQLLRNNAPTGLREQYKQVKTALVSEGLGYYINRQPAIPVKDARRAARAGGGVHQPVSVKRYRKLEYPSKEWIFVIENPASYPTLSSSSSSSSDWSMSE